MKKSITLLTGLVLMSSLFAGCIRTKEIREQQVVEFETVTFYGLFDDEELFFPAIQDFQASNPTITVQYKKFTNPEAYLDLIVNELAEGEGPDIFMMHNSWFPKHYKKLTPAPENIVNAEVFRSLFVEVTNDELIIPDENNVEQVWGIPLYVDSMALYFNKDHLEDAIPTRGRPGDTWSEIQNDVTLLNREDQSFERFERAGIAMGRHDNLLRAYDALMMLFLQHKIDFYDPELKEAIFASNLDAQAALELYTSFGLPSKKNYSWNKFLADGNSSTKEITTFAEGKVSMILGYSYLYDDINQEINRLKQLGRNTISMENVRIQEIPQVIDIKNSSETREAYASYFVPVVSRTSENPDLAWSFLATMVDEENMRAYNQATHRPSALRSLIQEQLQVPIYDVFAAQVGYASSIAMPDPEAFEEILLNAIERVIGTARVEDVLRSAEEEITSLIPKSGVKPIYVPAE